MKKILLVILMLFPLVLDAECTYKEKYELNALASYINYSYDYNRNTELFTITLYNVDEKVEIRYENAVYYPENGQILIENIAPGSRLSLDVYSTINNECYNEYLRVIYISVPYYNTFYGSILCEGHEDLDICNSEFLGYKISNKTFILLLNNDQFSLKEDEEKVEEEIDEVWYENVFVFFQDYYIKILVTIVTTVVTVSIYNVLYRKIRHKL